METYTVLVLGDVRDNPRVVKMLPAPLRIGDHIHLLFLLRRKSSGRSEELQVEGEYRITHVSFDTRGSSTKQVLVVEALGVAPTWRSVKNNPSWKRKLPLTVSPRTLLR